MIFSSRWINHESGDNEKNVKVSFKISFKNIDIYFFASSGYSGVWKIHVLGLAGYELIVTKSTLHVSLVNISILYISSRVPHILEEQLLLIFAKNSEDS